VALALWHLSGLNRQAKTVTLTGKVLRELGVERHAGYRGLEALEAAGLVTVERHPGRRPVVTILEPADTGV
jgi:DNA-binding MarR family transcriptional regulator